MTDSYVQVAADSTGKKIAMDLGTDATGATVYFQKALLVGDPADALSQFIDLQRDQNAILRAILRVLTDTTNSRTAEEDFASTPGENFDG